jgi:hypothetical protein
MTESGTASQLALYRTIRDVGFKLDAFVSFNALTTTLSRIVEIPGNHDYWNGVIMNLNGRLNKSIRTDHFDLASSYATLSTARYLVGVYGLCSTSGATPSEQIRAVGSFDPEDLGLVKARIAATRERAANADKIPFHLLAIHHSPSAGNPLCRGLSDRALRDLEQFPDVAGLLTGHAHSTRLPDPRPVIFNAGDGRHALLEVRCATTTKVALPLCPRPCEFLVHELRDGPSDSLEWFTTRWIFVGARFERQQPEQVMSFAPAPQP